MAADTFSSWLEEQWATADEIVDTGETRADRTPRSVLVEDRAGDAWDLIERAHYDTRVRRGQNIERRIFLEVARRLHAERSAELEDALVLLARARNAVTVAVERLDVATAALSGACEAVSRDGGECLPPDLVSDRDEQTAKVIPLRRQTA